MKRYLLLLTAIYALGLTSFANLNAQMLGQVTYPIGTGGGGGSGIPQGGPLTQDLDGGDFNITNLAGVSGAGSTWSLISLDGSGNFSNNAFRWDGSGNLVALSFSGDGTNLTDVGSNGNSLYYANNENLTDGTSTLYYPSDDILADTSGSLYYSGSGKLTDGPGNLYLPRSASGANVLDSFGSPGNPGDVLISGGNGAGVGWSTDLSTGTVSGEPLSGLYDGTTDLNVDQVTANGLILNGDGSEILKVFGSSGNVPSSDGSISGIAAFQTDGSLVHAVAGTDYDLPAIVTSSASTSGTVTFINPAGHPNEALNITGTTTRLSLTIARPSTTRVGQDFTIYCDSAITTLTINGGTSQLPSNDPTTLVGGKAIIYEAINTTGTYIRIQ